MATVAQQPAPSDAVKRGVLIWLTLQNSVHTLLVRYSRARPVSVMFLSSVAVFWTENVKLAICILAVFLESENPKVGVESLWSTVVLQPWDTAKVCVLSFIYTLQNNLFYLAASHLNAATFMVTSQLKIFTTAIFAVIILRKQLLGAQWLALLLLFVGVSIVQLEQSASAKSTLPITNTPGPGTIHVNTTTTASPAVTRTESPSIGFAAVVAASTLSGFAGIYFEKILKSASPVSVWMRNVQLAVCAVPIAFVTAHTKDAVLIGQKGFMQGFDTVVWCTVFWYGIGGLSVAIVIKYADNIAKNFATSVAIIISTVASMYIFAFEPSLKFCVGASLVIGSIFLYSMPSQPTVNTNTVQIKSTRG